MYRKWFGRGKNSYPSLKYAWRSQGTWFYDEVHAFIWGTNVWLAFDPLDDSPTIAYSGDWGTHMRVYFAQKDAGSWSHESVALLQPLPPAQSVSLAYHPNGQYPAIVYAGQSNEGIHYTTRSESGWSKPEVFDAVDPDEIGGDYYRPRALSLGFGGDGTAYVGYRGSGYYSTFRIAANDGTGWQIVHSEGLYYLEETDIAVSPVAVARPMSGCWHTTHQRA